jgi:VWFA-related protein
MIQRKDDPEIQPVFLPAHTLVERPRVKSRSLCFVSMASLVFVSNIVLAQSAANAAPKDTSADQPVTTMSVQVKVVNVFATARDKHGKIVNGLNKDDFTLTEDGRPQTIRYFARETDIPLTLGLLVDTSMSQRRVLGEERSASQSFLNQMVREDKDKAFVIHFDHEVELLQDLTSSHEKLEAALQSLEAPQFTRTSGGGSPGGGSTDPNSGRGSGRHRGGGGTTLYDSVYLASNELMQKQQGRKSVIVLSDGVDMGSKESLDEAIESAQRADTVVYSILFKDDEAYGNGGGFGRTGISIPGMGGPGRGGMGGPGRGGHRYPEQHADGKKVLERISKETGGRLFEVSKKESVDQIYAQIQEELRNQYSLGYSPDRGAESGYRKIQVAVKQKDVAVQAREGYYGDK